MDFRPLRVQQVFGCLYDAAPEIEWRCYGLGIILYSERGLDAGLSSVWFGTCLPSKRCCQPFVLLCVVSLVPCFLCSEVGGPH